MTKKEIHITLHSCAMLVCHVHRWMCTPYTQHEFLLESRMLVKSYLKPELQGK